jgi:hypothetical protein
MDLVRCADKDIMTQQYNAAQFVQLGMTRLRAMVAVTPELCAPRYYSTGPRATGSSGIVSVSDIIGSVSPLPDAALDNLLSDVARACLLKVVCKLTIGDAHACDAWPSKDMCVVLSVGANRLLILSRACVMRRRDTEGNVALLRAAVRQFERQPDLLSEVTLDHSIKMAYFESEWPESPDDSSSDDSSSDDSALRESASRESALRESALRVVDGSCAVPSSVVLHHENGTVVLLKTSAMVAGSTMAWALANHNDLSLDSCYLDSAIFQLRQALHLVGLLCLSHALHIRVARANRNALQ